ncbi:hypothetical protein RYX36_012908 [Vicia faba]
MMTSRRVRAELEHNPYKRRKFWDCFVRTFHTTRLHDWGLIYIPKFLKLSNDRISKLKAQCNDFEVDPWSHGDYESDERTLHGAGGGNNDDDIRYLSNLIMRLEGSVLYGPEIGIWYKRTPHEKGKYNFEGRYDLVRFIKTVQKVGLYVNLRIGPYVCAEWNFGGIPVWLKYVPGISFRTDNEPFKVELSLISFHDLVWFIRVNSSLE